MEKEHISIPKKPFEQYKWRWATLTPTESLNTPSVFLGVLRVFYRYNHFAPSSFEVMEGLEVVQNETNTSVDLVRTQERNLVRNSGQYWKAFGLLESQSGKIEVTSFGKELAEGRISPIEFATTIIKTLELPNRKIQPENECLLWDIAKLKIRPLQLILDILSLLYKEYGVKDAYITPNELSSITIPLAGDKATLQTHISALKQYRLGLLDISQWPNCTTSANDKRMAREFLLFLSNYGFCEIINLGNNQTQRFMMANISIDEVEYLDKIIIPETNSLTNISKIIRETNIPSYVERKRVNREILERPNQAIFRKNIINAYNRSCIITGVTIENVLEAAHIKPVSENGNDLIENGLCLRSDIHLLYDSGHLKITPDGYVLLSDLAKTKNNYGGLPEKINFPNFVNVEYIDWRNKYT